MLCFVRRIFWCHVLDPKTQGWIWERSAKCVGSSNRTVILQKRKFLQNFLVSKYNMRRPWRVYVKCCKDESMGQQYRTFVLLFVTAGILRAPSSDSYSWVSYGLCFASMRTAPVTSELLSSSRYGIAHSRKPFSSLCAFEICTPTGFWKWNEGLLHL